MEILEYRRFLASLSTDDFIDYLYNLDLSTLSDEERLELEFRLSEIRTRKVLVYLSIFGFLLMVASETSDRSGAVKELMSALNITRPDIREKGEKPFDLVWVTQPGACDECLMHEGKIYGKTTDDIPKLHDHCLCEFVKVYREEATTMKSIGLRWTPGGAVRAMKKGNKMALEVLAAPFGSPERRDRLDQYLTANTDFMIEVGDRRPTMYLHGYSPRRRAMDKPPVLGVAEVSKVDEMGVWMYTELDDSPLSKRTWEAAKRGEARASTGSIAHLVRPRGDEPGEVTCWPIAELSVWDGNEDRVPVSDDAIVIPLRALFDDLQLDFDERFEAGEAMDLISSRSKMMDLNDLEVEMTPEELQAAIDAGVATALLAVEKKKESAIEAEKAMRAKIEKELKADPKYRATFNTQKEIKDGLFVTPEQEARGRTIEDLKETHEYIWNLRHAIGGMRAIPLEETEAAEGLPFVPQDALDEIWLKRDAFSIARLAGIRVLQTDRLIFNVPREATPMTAMAVIAEAAAYVANEVAFNLNPVTVVKRGSLLSATEELLEDQSLFQAWILPAVGRAWGLGENIDLHAALITKAGVAIALKDAPTDAEIMGAYFALPQVYRKGACWFSADATMLYMRALLIATPRAYGDFPAFGGGEYETFMGKKFFTDANWKTLAVAVATDEFLGFANLNEALSLVERRGVKILVDPFTDAGTGVTNYYPSVRYAITAQNPDAISNLTDLAD